MKAMVSTRLADAIMYELWVGSDGTSARTIYYSGPPWLIGKALFMKQVYVVKQRLGITKEDAEKREAEVWHKTLEFVAFPVKYFQLLSFYVLHAIRNRRCCEAHSWSLRQISWRLDRLLHSHNSFQTLH